MMSRNAGGSSRVPRRGSTLLIVLWTVSLISLVVVSVQISSLRQSMQARETVARTRAKWAARAGIERIIARLGWENENPEPSGPITLIADLAGLAEESFDAASYQIAYTEGGSLIAGPFDEHARINVNLMSEEGLMLLPYMTEDVADSILDWIDEDDEIREMGAEAGYYTVGAFPYEPRNGPVRSIAELELVAGVVPDLVRGEDWNLNGRLDPNEDDGDLSWPPDNEDGELDGGWSTYITASSVDGGLAPGGLERLNLTDEEVTAAEVASRVGIDEEQAELLIAYAGSGSNTMTGLITTELNYITENGSVAPQPVNAVRPLSDAELRVVFEELTFSAPEEAGPGKLNLNTVPIEVFDYVPEISPAIADAIVLERDRRREGFESILDLLDIPGISETVLAELAEVMDVKANAYRVCCRGRDEATGIEVEIIAVIDRSTLPIRIMEYTVR
jgi:type II secretory pathway component PulK